MYRRIREPFGKAGLIVAVVALVAALVGGAYAATGGQPLASSSGKHNKKSNAGLNGKQKKEVKKISQGEAKKYANSNPGAPGATGPQGPQGSPGSPGANGSDGTSATTAAYTGEECPNGGVEVKSASPTAYVCNGENGQTGFTETLPSGKSERGTWAIGIVPESKAAEEGTAQVWTSISFPIPLEAPVHAHAIENGGEPTEECPGSAAEPAAAPGNICFYQGAQLSGTVQVAPTKVFDIEDHALTKAGRSGAALHFASLHAGEYGNGVWVVTAP